MNSVIVNNPTVKDFFNAMINCYPHKGYIQFVYKAMRMVGQKDMKTNKNKENRRTLVDAFTQSIPFKMLEQRGFQSENSFFSCTSVSLGHRYATQYRSEYN